ncbi:MAG: YhjD/YihY/BrkB family envelope integrity protein, partial [Woeseiaceae bacterium]|nr:YhjD/YihY/BrkB family envelope integrity protein [Woeseiaceae bacterium]
TMRAMSLVYSTLLSVVPLLAFSFSVLKGFGVHEQVAQQLYGFLEPLGDKGVAYTDQLLALVNSVNVRTLAGLGLAFFIYTAVSMVQKTEEAFNYVWYVSKPRSFARRFVEYVFVLLIGPVAIFIALGMISALQSAWLIEYLTDNTFFGAAMAAAGRLTPYAIVCGVFTFLYIFMPNTNVRFQAALVGGVFGGFLWATTSVLFATFVVNSVRNNAIFAGFAVPITALVWIYLNWLILLIGSQLAFYFQNPAYLRIGRRDPRLSNAMRERLALNIMYLVGREFRTPSGGVTLNDISEKLRMPTLAIAPIATKLEEAGLLTVTEQEHLQPGREMSRVTLNDILEIVRGKGETGSHVPPCWDDDVDAIGATLDEAVSGAVDGKTLADILDAAES